MTLNNHFALNRPTVFRVESCSMDALVLRHDCFKIHGVAYILSALSSKDVVCGFWWYKSYADIRRGSLLRWCQMRVRLSKVWLFSVDRYIFRMKFPTGFTYRNLNGFARFPGDSTALVVISIVAVHSSTALYAIFTMVYNPLAASWGQFKFGQLILRKLSKIVATRRHILRKMHQTRFWLGLRWGS